MILEPVSAPGLFVRMSIMREHLEGALDAFHTAAYLRLIDHPTQLPLVDLETRGARLENAYQEYRAQLAGLLSPPPL